VTDTRAPLVLHILRQGRCTLVTTLQMYRILALHCLIYAYSLSVLYHEGIKYGDTQATISGMLTAMCFLFISRSQPLKKLASKRPFNRIFTPFMFASILGQFAIHLSALMYISDLSQSLVDAYVIWFRSESLIDARIAAKLSPSQMRTSNPISSIPLCS